MTKLEQAARQALEALETLAYGDSYKTHNAAATLREALAEQAEQEPVVKIHKYNEFQTLGSLNLPIGTKLYAAPVRTKDLTDDEIVKVTGCEKDRPLWLTVSSIARAVIAAYKEKNK